MVDIVSPETRSRMMAGIRGKHTKPELLVRRALFAAGFRFRLHRKDLPGAPDIVLPKWKVAIFVHGCFWHQHPNCKLAKVPASRPEFWMKKLAGNIERDRRASAELNASGWRVLTIWECATRDRALVADLPSVLTSWIQGSQPIGEIALALPG
ncbi:DNA mismatch endonuclease Vsr [Caballeronia sp. LZ029]|uniref:very short patch repair endonuclease n=1 Tax=Caballeronia sp. LZ029 TaxID=3038564 RepID=UPI0028575A6F|nr:DNA mismatch endonuclease Vsr [Caballeronia sp. LZ029]MDR5744443.1 DNA mismatch endonuclease Vsr [Caballeronia sp. LZ029]